MPTRTEVLAVFESYMELGYSRYMAVRATANSMGLTMREVGLLLHPAGIKHSKEKTDA